MKYGRYPGVGAGADEQALTADAALVWQEMQLLVATAGDGGGGEGGGESGDFPLLSGAYAAEVTRFAAAELHNTAALIGGVAAQEIVKVLTQQWLPANNTIIYNGIAGTAQTYEL